MSLFNNSQMMGASGAGTYEIERSLRFNSDDSTRLTRTPSSSADDQIQTYSFWCKRCVVDEAHYVITAWNGYNTDRIGFTNDGQFFVEFKDGSTTEAEWHSDKKFRDPSSWYHCVVAIDTTQSTENHRFRVYINGVEITDWDLDNDVSQNYEIKGFGQSGKFHAMGAYTNSGSTVHKHFNGYIAEFHFIDGAQKVPGDFGKTDPATGQWIPIEYKGTYGSQGWYLNYSDNSNTTSTTLGADSSGNGLNWTPVNFSVSAGPDNDSFEDTPTNNWCTLNPNKFGLDDKATFGNGNLKMTHNASTAWQHTMGTIPVKSGKWYYEVKLITRPTATTENWIVGFYDVAYEYNALYYGLSGNLGWGMDTNVAEVFKDTDRTTAYGSAISAGDIIQIALDVDAEKFWVGVNNTWTSSGDPAGGSNPSISSIGSGKTWIPKISTYAYNTPYGVMEANFGAQGFTYTPPTGFKAINAANALSEPTIKKGTDHFDTALYTGSGSGNQSITSLDFQPDLVWIKSRDSSGFHVLADSVRGTGKILASNSTNNENPFGGHSATAFSAFLSNGFTVGYTTTWWTNGTSSGSEPQVSWNWKGGGSSSSNSDGDITSTVSVNATAGFSIVGWTGNGTDGETIGHGLGVKPDFIVIKKRENNSGGNTGWWNVQHVGLQNGPIATSSVFTLSGYPNGTLYLNDNHAQSSYVFDNQVNGNTDTFIAYCFSGVEGYSKFGKYTGNGITDGAFVYTGFRPAFIMYKRTDTTADWGMHDNKRDPHNAINSFLYPNITDDEWTASGTDEGFDFLSNGFKARNTGTMLNASGGTYVYLAFAETPFKYANAQ